MKFNFEIGLTAGQVHTRQICARAAVRAVICVGSRLLMIRSRQGDYKFPGGGVETGEDDAAALQREIREETGYEQAHIGEMLGTVIERRWDTTVPGAVFEMISHYYACQVSGQPGPLWLDDYEAELNFEPVLINRSYALQINESLLQHDHAHEQNPWLKRETEVLHSLPHYCSLGD